MHNLQQHLLQKTPAAALLGLPDGMPESIWAIMVDSATERNFQLPRIKGRSGSKELTNRPYWGFKLIAAYAPNYGFCPFIVHNSSKAGANLMLTVVWVTLLRMRDYHGYLPDELHLQLDSTSAENKNSTVISFCAWLVARGTVKRVRLFYLPVGHTHIIIDQVFIGTRNTSKKLPNSPHILPTHPPYPSSPTHLGLRGDHQAPEARRVPRPL